VSRRAYIEVGAVLTAVILLIVAAAAWPFGKTPVDRIGLSYGGGPFEGESFQSIVDPSHGLFFNGWADHLFLYPTTQRNYIISTNPEEGDRGGSDTVTVPSSDGIPVTFQTATYFKLNTGCDDPDDVANCIIRKFHEQLGKKYAAWTDDGWRHLLNDHFRQQIENSLRQESTQYEAQEIYDSHAVQASIQEHIGAVLKDVINRSLGAPYFCGPTYVQGADDCPDFTFVIKDIIVPDNVLAALQDVRTSQIQIQTRQNEVKQAKLQAKAVRVLTQNNNLTCEYVLLQSIQQHQSLPIAPCLQSLSVGK
jgi:regulator of protease activity HflC (stomatin/prohibitin superfamily)